MNLSFFKELMNPVVEKIKSLGYFAFYPLRSSRSSQIRGNWSFIVIDELVTLKVLYIYDRGILRVIANKEEDDDDFSLKDPRCIEKIINKIEEELPCKKT